VRSVLAILVTLVACNDSDVERLTAIKDEVCACKTASCAEKAMARVPTDIKSTPRSRTAAREMIECLARAQTAERPSTDPDAEGNAANPATQGSAAAEPGAGSAAAPSAGSTAAPAR
jgi:hypothetical protein